ncbi:nucleotide exchange factor GrpE [Eisenibacter elegans]|jgi:molecular chaperone GrpE|uniref:nucleotide exchange factor GrpE n=1 Tax=Eisenibacter elegans TaxID=997 RepID=UPI0004247472|nr:nucleotide exchange factor GrpE [Eisenibacter elegans]
MSQTTDNKDNQQKPETAPENEAANNAEMPNAEETVAETQAPTADPLAELAETKDKYLRLYADFENFRRRTSKERLELINSASQDLIQALLPVVDDFERAQKSIGDAPETLAIREGIDLIYNKLIRVLESKGLKAMESSVGKPFDSETQEAITQIPAPQDELKGKVVDELEKGYLLNEKVIRYAKVVVGS